MIVVGANLRALADQYRMTDDLAGVEESAISLTLDDHIARVTPPPDSVVTYGRALDADWIRETVLDGNGLVLAPGDSVLGCSTELVRMPPGYMGFLQTRGSLARHFVLVHCTDGQVDSGFEGRVTFELVNLGRYALRLWPGDAVALMFVYRTTTRGERYSGRYQGATGPTPPVQRRHGSPDPRRGGSPDRDRTIASSEGHPRHNP